MMRRGLFYKFFPVPRLLEMPSVGMDISEVSLRFVELIPKGKGFVLGKYGEFPIPPGTIAEGDIKDPETFRNVLMKVKKEAGLHFVRASLSESHAYLADMEIARVSQKQLRDSIELQLEEHVPLPVSEVFFDYNVVEDIPGSPKMQVGVAVVPQAPVLKYIEAFSSAGLTLLSLEVDADALVRAILPPNTTDTVMIIEMGRVKAGVYIVTGKAVRFTSEIDIGAKTIALRLEKELGVSKEKANELLAGCYGDGTVAEEVVPVLYTFYSEIKDEIEKHFMYWNSRHERGANGEQSTIERVILAGSQSSLVGLGDYLSSGLRRHVELANPWNNVSPFHEYIPEIGSTDALRFATAIGLALHPYEVFGFL